VPAWNFAAVEPLTSYSSPARIKRFVMALVYSDPMVGAPEGLTDKLYWRRAKGEWHCSEKLAQVRGYISLCQRREIALVRGQQIARPEADLRCSVCDGLEMTLWGWDGSGRFRDGVRRASVGEGKASFQPSGYRHNRSPKFMFSKRQSVSQARRARRTQNNKKI
jgi:hypothetical protein